MLFHETEETHPDQAQRLELVRQALEAADLPGELVRLDVMPATPAQIARVHDPAYVDLVRLACEEGFRFIGSRETEVGPESYHAATLACGAAIGACETVLRGEVHRAFCAVRPPGHHAEYDHAMGFCLFNNVAVAAETVIREYGLERVAIVDLDVHHGNGTQHAFEDRADVLYISLHEFPGTLPYPGTGYAEERGRETGVGRTLNLPVDAGSGDEVYRQAFDGSLLPELDAYRPDFILVSVGFDALETDLQAHINLKPSSFQWMSRQLSEAADQLCAGRLVSVLEGGYDLNRIGACAVEHVRGMM
jgi:acetoin utilization deacetylase AcuC-like enzyme